MENNINVGIVKSSNLYNFHLYQNSLCGYEESLLDSNKYRVYQYNTRICVGEIDKSILDENILSVQKIARDIVEIGMLESSNGSWIVYPDELAEKYNVNVDLIKNNYKEIAEEINAQEEIMDQVQGIEDYCFDMNIGLAYIYAVDWECDENIDIAPDETALKKIEMYYKNDKYNPLQLIEIQVGIIDGLDVSLYDNPEYSYEYMREKRIEQYSSNRRIKAR